MCEAVGVLVEGAAGNQHVGACCRRSGDRRGTDAAVDFEIDGVGESGVIDHRPDLRDLRLHRRDVGLAAEARIDRHHQHQVDQVEHVGNRRGRRRRVECHRRVGAQIVDVAECAVQVCAGFCMHDQARAAGVDVLLGHHVGRVDHQVRLEWHRGVLAGRRDHIGAECEVRDELAVHHVPLDQIDASRLELGDLVAELGEIGGQDGRSDLDGTTHRERN